MSDSLSLDGAIKLAARIRDYWKSRGYEGICAEPVEIMMIDEYRSDWGRASDQPKSIFGIRSNIGANGFPPKRVLLAAQG